MTTKEKKKKLSMSIQLNELNEPVHVTTASNAAYKKDETVLQLCSQRNISQLFRYIDQCKDHDLLYHNMNEHNQTKFMHLLSSFHLHKPLGYVRKRCPKTTYVMDFQGNTPLHTAMYTLYHVFHTAMIDNKEYQPMCIDHNNDFLETFCILCHDGYDLQMKNHFQETPMMYIEKINTYMITEYTELFQTFVQEVSILQNFLAEPSPLPSVLREIVQTIIFHANQLIETFHLIPVESTLFYDYVVSLCQITPNQITNIHTFIETNYIKQFVEFVTQKTEKYKILLTVIQWDQFIGEIKFKELFGYIEQYLVLVNATPLRAIYKKNEKELTKAMLEMYAKHISIHLMVEMETSQIENAMYDIIHQSYHRRYTPKNADYAANRFLREIIEQYQPTSIMVYERLMNFITKQKELLYQSIDKIISIKQLMHQLEYCQCIKHQRLLTHYTYEYIATKHPQDVLLYHSNNMELLLQLINYIFQLRLDYGFMEFNIYLSKILLEAQSLLQEQDYQILHNQLVVNLNKELRQQQVSSQN